MNRNVVVDQRSSFIAEYAAKRQHQLERAKQLREQRVTSTNSGSGSGGGGSEDLPARPQNLRTSSFQQQQQQGANDGISRVQPQSNGIDYPPPIARGGGGGGAAPPLSRQSSIEVTEHSFREATQRGIITPDQARQLWAVLSDQATVVTPLGGGKQPHHAQAKSSSSGYNPNHYAVPLNEQHSNVSPSAGGATYRGSFAHQLALGSTTSPLDVDEHTPTGGEYGQPSKVSKSLAARVGGGTTTSRKPEWNSDFAAQDDYDYDAPRREELAPTNARHATNARDAGKRRPEWNDDAGYAEPEPPAAPKVAPKVAGGALGGRSRRREDEDVTPLDQVMPPKQQPASRQGKPQQLPQRTAPNVRVGGSRQQPPPPPEPTGPVEQSPEEVAEFLRQKEEARRQFEEALEEADTREPLAPCRVCGRNFRESVIDRHENACKVAHKKRRAFDSKANRLQGIEGIDEVMAPQPSRKGARQQQAAPVSRGAPGGAGGDKPVPQRQGMPKWKLQHEQFQVALAAIRHAANPGSSAPPPPMPEALDDRVPCPHCSRRFQSETAARHIPQCAKTINKPKGLVRPGQPQIGRR